MRMTVPAFKYGVHTNQSLSKEVSMDTALQLVEKNRGKVHEMVPVGDGTSGVRFGEEERLRRHRGRKNKTSLPGMKVIMSSL